MLTVDNNATSNQKKLGEKIMTPVSIFENSAASIDATSLANKSAFLRLSFGVLGNERKVETDVLKEEIKEQTAVERLTTTMRLLDSPELTEIKKQDALFKRELFKYCLPAFPSVLAVPKGAVAKIAQKCKSYAIERSNL